MTIHRTMSMVLGTTMLAVLAAGATAVAQDELSGDVRLDGSSTVGPLSEVAAELFMAENPGVRVTVAISGTSGGFGKFCSGETDMNDASRPIKESEIELCGQNGIAFDAIQVANDALALLVNANNPVSCLTKDQATQIWDVDSTVQTWGDVEGLDLPEEFAAAELGKALYGPGSDSGTFDFFTEAINGEEGRIRIDYIDIGEDDNAAVTAVEGIEHAMGYVPYSYFQIAAAGGLVKPLAIDMGAQGVMLPGRDAPEVLGCVEATIENVQNGSYVPLGRPLYVYASDTALARPEVLAFMDFYVQNAVEIAELAGFVPMTDEQIEEQKAKIAALIGAAE